MWRMPQWDIMESGGWQTASERIPTMYSNTANHELYRIAELRRQEDASIARDRRRYKLLPQAPSRVDQIRSRLGSALVVMGTRLMAGPGEKVNTSEMAAGKP
jgi:hypothetical protein